MIRLFLFNSILFISLNSHATLSPQTSPLSKKTIHIIVDERGIISIGRDTLTSDNLALYIHQRLYKSYLGTGKMYDQILFTKASKNIDELVVDVIIKEIKAGQQKALTDLCIQKYKDYYENISDRQQAKLRKYFPVLFQTKYN